MSSFLNFTCGAARNRSPRGILRLAVLNPCAAHGILPRALCVCTACGEALRSITNLSLKQNFGFEILKQGLKFISAPALFGRNSFFKIYVRFKFKDGLQKRSCLASPSATVTSSVSSSSAQAQAPIQASAQVPAQIQASAQVQARARTKFKSVVSKSAIFRLAVSQSTLAKRAIFKFTRFMKFAIFSRAALKFKNSPLAQRRALV